MGYAALCRVRDPRGSFSSVPVPERSPALTTTPPRAEPLPDPGSFRQHRQPQPRRAAGPAAGHPAPPGRSGRSREGAGGNTAFWGRLRPGRVPPHLLAPGGSPAVPPAPGIPPLIAEGITRPVESSKARAALAAPLSSGLKTNPSGSMDLVRVFENKGGAEWPGSRDRAGALLALLTPKSPHPALTITLASLTALELTLGLGSVGRERLSFQIRLYQSDARQPTAIPVPFVGAAAWRWVSVGKSCWWLQRDSSGTTRGLRDVSGPTPQPWLSHRL